MQARRILLINHEYPPLGGSAGNATRHIAKALARLGHKPFVLTAASSGLRIDEEDEGVTIRRLPTWYSAGATKDEKPSSAAQGTAFLFAALRAAPNLARQWKVDIALCFFGLPGGPLGWLLKRRLGIPYIIALQGGDVPAPELAQQGTYNRLVNRGLNYLWRNAGAVVANSDRLAEEARRHDPKTPIAVIPHGADTHGITPKEDYAPRGDVSLLYVGRLAEQRGFDVLLPALAMLSSALKWKLTLAGDGPDWPNVAASAARLALIDRIDLRGWQGWSVLPELYRSADVFVLPSYDEGMPAALLEAMATGLPVVSTHVAGRGEAVLHEKTGLLVPPQDSEALADALTLMIADPSRWETFGRAGRARVESYYSWTKVAEQWVETVERALHKT
ncbi:MAG: glycosyltransferase family 4 protein [Rhodospirillaceae bacterium]|nr:glycosyltransferase family 4 protein [Rhodospirillaceae bacterium]